MGQDGTECAASTAWHDNRIPEFAGDVLDALYGSLYSSLPQLAFGELHHTSTYVAYAGGHPQALFLFTCDGKAARVINEGMRVDAIEADRFSEQLFGRSPGIARIDFHAIAYDGKPASVRTFCFALNEDIVIDLPASEADYLAGLGKATRKSVRHNLARAQGLTHCVLPGSEVDATLVDQIVGFNHARLAAKRRQSALDSIAANRLLALVRAHGMAGSVRMHGRLCAGTLASRIGDDIYSLVNAHDPEFDHLGMGNLSRYLMIVAAIRAGARRFHLLGGNFSSKRLWGAERRVLHHLVMYRNPWQIFVDLPHLGALALCEQRYRLGVSLDDGTPDSRVAGAHGAIAWMAALARRLRAAKQAGIRSLRDKRAAAR